MCSPFIINREITSLHHNVLFDILQQHHETNCSALDLTLNWLKGQSAAAVRTVNLVCVFAALTSALTLWRWLNGLFKCENDHSLLLNTSAAFRGLHRGSEAFISFTNPLLGWHLCHYPLHFLLSHRFCHCPDFFLSLAKLVFFGCFIVIIVINGVLIVFYVFLWIFNFVTFFYS